jgi:hypothetical protein
MAGPTHDPARATAADGVPGPAGTTGRETGRGPDGTERADG